MLFAWGPCKVFAFQSLSLSSATGQDKDVQSGKEKTSTGL